MDKTPISRHDPVDFDRDESGEQTRPITAIDLFAGPGGWDVAAETLGIDTIGVEYDSAANMTRAVCGYKTIEDDVLNVEPFASDLLIASPPCPAYSAAGKGAGREALDRVLANIKHLAHGGDFRPEEYDDVRVPLVLTPLI